MSVVWAGIKPLSVSQFWDSASPKLISDFLLCPIKHHFISSGIWLDSQTPRNSHHFWTYCFLTESSILKFPIFPNTRVSFSCLSYWIRLCEWSRSPNSHPQTLLLTGALAIPAKNKFPGPLQNCTFIFIALNKTGNKALKKLLLPHFNFWDGLTYSDCGSVFDLMGSVTLILTTFFILQNWMKVRRRGIWEKQEVLPSVNSHHVLGWLTEEGGVCR